MNLSKLKLFFSLAMLATCMFFLNACDKEDGPASARYHWFSPDSGLEGDEVTITGQNFSTTASENIVKFNRTSAAVIEATTTKLTVKVPEGATTGKLTVSVGGELATSTDDFTVVFIKQVATGYFYTLMLKSDNTLWATGDNKHGKLGDGTDTNISTSKKIMEDVKTPVRRRNCSSDKLIICSYLLINKFNYFPTFARSLIKEDLSLTYKG